MDRKGSPGEATAAVRSSEDCTLFRAVSSSCASTASSLSQLMAVMQKGCQKKNTARLICLSGQSLNDVGVSEFTAQRLWWNAQQGTLEWGEVGRRQVSERHRDKNATTANSQILLLFLFTCILVNEAGAT